MANAEIKILEAEKLHQPIIVAVRRIPTIPLQGKNKQKTWERWVRLDTENQSKLQLYPIVKGRDF